MKHSKILIISILLSLIFTPVNAESTKLLNLYKQAENYDTEIFAAQSAYLAERENESIALASALPKLNASVSSSRTNSNSDLQGNDTYKSTSYSVSLSQSLINLPTWYTLSSSEQNSLRAEAVYLAAQQNLILNVSSAYFNVLREEENLRSDQSQEAAVKRQYEQAKEQFDVGLIAVTDVHKAQASYDASQTNRIRSEGNLTIAKVSLYRLTGTTINNLGALKADFPITMDTSQGVEQWTETASAHNLDIKIARFALKSLEKDLKSKRATHLPTLDLTANYSFNELSNAKTSIPDLTRPEDEQSSISISLNVPIYSGGAVQAGARQTRHLVEQARHQLISTQRQAEVDVKTEYINIKTNIQTIEALKQNIVSHESALEATREGYNVGTRNIVEVLNAERNYFTALKDYANARFDFVESTLRIKRAVGTLNVKDLEELNAWFAS